jgi:hypothetical protein
MGPTPQSPIPIPNPQSPIPMNIVINLKVNFNKKNIYFYNFNNLINLFINDKNK